MANKVMSVLRCLGIVVVLMSGMLFVMDSGVGSHSKTNSLDESRPVLSEVFFLERNEMVDFWYPENLNFATEFNLAKFDRSETRFPGDTEAPNVLSFNFDPKTIDTSTSSQDITFTMHLTDDQSGVDHAMLRFDFPNNPHHSIGRLMTRFGSVRPSPLFLTLRTFLTSFHLAGSSNPLSKPTKRYSSCNSSCSHQGLASFCKK